MVVECHARADHIEHYRSLVRNRSLQHAVELLLVARKRTSHKRRSLLNSHCAGIDWRQIVDDSRLQLRPDIRSGRELSLGQPVHPVVFDYVNDRQIAPHQVNELSNANRSRVAITADA